MSRKQKISAALKRIPAQIVLKNGRVVNVFTREVENKDIAIVDGEIVGVGDYEGEKEVDLKGKMVVPGLIDAHLHIESSLVAPSILSGVLFDHGVTSAVVDPHEIANVAGNDGIDFMLEDGRKAQIDYFFMIPSSVPSCDFEINGAGELLAEQMRAYKESPDVLGLAEVMRMQDVLEMDSRMEEKLALFSDRIIDGHAPGLSEYELKAYRLAGIQTDHEATTYEEARQRLADGFWLLIRQGSQAKNLKELLLGLLEHHIPLDRCAFCTDDKHLDDILKEGTIDACIKEAIALGCDPFEALLMATLRPATLYGLDKKGAIAPGYDADLVVIDDLEHFRIDSVWKKGEEKGREKTDCEIPVSLQNSVRLPKMETEDLRKDLSAFPVIEIVENQLLTTKKELQDGKNSSKKGITNHLIAIERYGKSGEYALCLLQGFNMKQGALVQSYAHDSHNVFGVYQDDQDLLLALKRLQKIQGGIVLAQNGEIVFELPLAIGGLMSNQPAEEVAGKLEELKTRLQNLGVGKGVDPFGTLSFLSLPVIPQIRLTPQGLYDVCSNQFLLEEERKK